MTDDQGYRDVGFNGSPDIPTPHLDSIARNGVRFTDGYVAYSVCSPSRAAFLTGRYGQRFGYERNPRYQPGNVKSGLARTETTIADALKAAGYRTGLVGKWHLGAHPDLHPLKRGFDEFFGHLGGGHRYLPEELTIEDHTQAANDEGRSYRTLIHRNHEPVRTTKYLTDEFSDAAVDFIGRHHEAPFFLFLSYNAPHAPLQATEEYLARFPQIKDPRRRTYAAMVSAVDDGVGRVLAELASRGITDDTLVFFLSDNGGPTDANTANNAPLRGMKGSLWEGGVRVPFAAQWPGKIRAGSVFQHPVISMDIFATIAAAANASIPAERPLDGANLLPFLSGERNGAPHEMLFLRMYDRGAYAVRAGPYKLVIPTKDAPPELYHLRRDISEKQNLADSHPEIVADLRQRLARWEAGMIAPVFEGLLSNNAKAK
jgi:arylsulfatase A-like enzyme